MKSQARTIYIDDDTYSNISELANMKRVSISAMIRILINESFFDHVHFKNEAVTANDN
jgi:predicted CopG family antitoxin